MTEAIYEATLRGVGFKLYDAGENRRLIVDMEQDAWEWLLDQLRPTSDELPNMIRAALAKRGSQ